MLSMVVGKHIVMMFTRSLHCSFHHFDIPLCSISIFIGGFSVSSVFYCYMRKRNSSYDIQNNATICHFRKPLMSPRKPLCDNCALWYSTHKWVSALCDRSNWICKRGGIFCTDGRMTAWQTCGIHWICISHINHKFCKYCTFISTVRKENHISDKYTTGLVEIYM